MNRSLIFDRTVVLCSRWLGGAEMFALERLKATGRGRIVCNPTLARLVRSDGYDREVDVVENEGLEPLASRIGIHNVRHAALALRTEFRSSNVLLGNLNAAAMQLVVPEHARIDCFIHDNTHYLNIKARVLIALIAWRSRRLYFPCLHAMGKLPLRHMLARRLAVEYFGSVQGLPHVGAPVDGPVRIATVGRIGPDKDPALAARVGLAIADLMGPVELTLLGDIVNPRYASQVMAMARHDLRIVQLRLSHEEVVPFLSKQHLVLHTSPIESLPLVLFEANAAGVPFFALPVGGIPEVLPPPFLLPSEPIRAAHQIARMISVKSSEPVPLGP